MFEKILIAHRGDPLPGGSTAAQPNRIVAEGRKGGFTPGILHV